MQRFPRNTRPIYHWIALALKKQHDFEEILLFIGLIMHEEYNLEPSMTFFIQHFDPSRKDLVEYKHARIKIHNDFFAKHLRSLFSVFVRT